MGERRMKYILITTSTCTKCPDVKDMLDKKGIEYELIVADQDPQGMVTAMTHAVSEVPTLLRINDDFSVDKASQHEISKWFK